MKRNNIVHIALEILTYEPEWYLAFFFGPHGEKLPGRALGKPATAWVVLGELALQIGFLIRNTSLKPQNKRCKSSQHLFFYATENQRVSLAPTASELVKLGENVDAVYTGKKTTSCLTESIEAHSIKLGLRETLCSVSVLILRIQAISRIVSENRKNIRQRNFRRFLRSHAYLVYFISMLRQTRPTFVIMSNDHNPQNKCLLAAARYIGVRTVYMQHASVSDLFPALRFDYAFLDGKRSSDIYDRCEANAPPEELNQNRTKVILTGQKKRPAKIDDDPHYEVAIAINGLDIAADVIAFAEKLLEKDVRVSLRWHPTQRRDEVTAIRDWVKKHGNVSLSDPALESAADFLGKAKWLVAGNSSIHLEAALMGVASLYMEFGRPIVADYYGYVSLGISMQISSANDLLYLMTGRKPYHKPRTEALQEFSATFGTIWEGYEGALTAQYLKYFRTGIMN